MHAQRLGELLRDYPGLWVAVKDDEVVLAYESAYELIQELMPREIRDTTIVRAPAPDDPLSVGMG